MKTGEVFSAGRVPAHGTPSKPPDRPRPGHPKFEAHTLPHSTAPMCRSTVSMRYRAACQLAAGGAGSDPAPHPLPPWVCLDCVRQQCRDGDQEPRGEKCNRDVNHDKPLPVCVDEVTLRQPALRHAALHIESQFPLVPLAYLVTARPPSIRYVTGTSGKRVNGC